MRLQNPALASLALAVGLGLGACRPAAAPEAPASAPQASDTTAPAPASPAAPDPLAPSATDAASAAPTATSVAPASATAIARAEGENPGLRIEVTELRRSSGDTVSLKFVLINETDEAVSTTSNFLGDTSKSQDYASVGGVHLVDAIGKKKYMVVRDSETHCVCSDSIKSVPAKGRLNLWAKYPAPPAGTTMVNIVVPHFSPMDDVPIAH